MFAYDLVKRNKCLITVGTSYSSPMDATLEFLEKQVSEEPETQKQDPQKFGEALKTLQKSVVSATAAKPVRGPVMVPCYFLSVPKITMQSQWGYNSALSGIQETINNGMTAFNKFGGAVGDILSDDSVRDASRAIKDAIRQKYDAGVQKEGISQEKFNEDKGIAVGKNLVHILKSAAKSASKQTTISKQGQTLEWSGVDPIQFSLDVLFCNEDTGVHMGVLFPLMEAVSFSRVMFGNQMYGPRGFNSAGLGFQGIQEALSGNYDSLHSLLLWNERVSFGSVTIPTRTTIMDIPRLLVIDSLSIEKPDQLFFDPSDEGTSPMYKWIKATIGFKTVCPVPGTMFMMGDRGDGRPPGVNTSLHNFFGPHTAVQNTGYAKPIKDAPGFYSDSDFYGNFSKQMNQGAKTTNQVKKS